MLSMRLLVKDQQINTVTVEWHAKPSLLHFRRRKGQRGAGVRKRTNPLLRLDNHQVSVKWGICEGSEGIHYQRS